MAVNKSTTGQYPYNSPFAVDEKLDCPDYLNSEDTVSDTAFPAFPPKGHLVNATPQFDEAAWGSSETRRVQQQQGKGTIKRGDTIPVRKP